MLGMAEGWRRLAEAFENMEVIGGHVEWIKGYIPRIIIDTEQSDIKDDPAPYPKTFDISQDGAGTITLTRCHYMRGSVFKYTTYEPTASIATGTLSAVINTTTGEITAQFGATNDPNNPELFPVALYQLTASTDGLTATVDYDLRGSVVVAYE